MTTPHRDLAHAIHWQRSLERSRHRRAITPAVRRAQARRRRASIALSTLMVAGPTGSLFAAAGFGLGPRADVAQASPANRAIDTAGAPGAMAFERGDRGPQVAEIQRALGVEADGIFGPVTEAAVRAFQQREGLQVDGVVGPVTWTALFGLEDAAAAAGARDGSVAVIVRELDGGRADASDRPAGAPESSGVDSTAGATVPAVGGGPAEARPVSGVRDGASGPGTGERSAGGQRPATLGAPEAPATPAPRKGASKRAPGSGACGSLRLGSPVKGIVTSSYGPRWGRMHEGLDIAAATGTPIRAAECGIVSFSGSQSGYGNMVCVKHSSRFETCYAHMTRAAVTAGQRVQKGQVIGYVGCTGSCTGPHLHFETRVDGRARDPRPYLAGAAVPGTPTVKTAAAPQATTAARIGASSAATAAKASVGWSTNGGGATATAPRATVAAEPQATHSAPAPSAPPAVPQTPAPQATVPQGTAPQAAAPQPTAPAALAPQATPPATSAPTTAPQPAAPADPAPQAPAPRTASPPTPEPPAAVTEAEAPAPAVPQASAPTADAPPVTTPSVPQSTAPEQAAPAVEPEAAAPSTPEPQVAPSDAASGRP